MEKTKVAGPIKIRNLVTVCDWGRLSSPTRIREMSAVQKNNSSPLVNRHFTFNRVIPVWIINQKKLLAFSDKSDFLNKFFFAHFHCERWRNLYPVVVVFFQISFMKR